MGCFDFSFQISDLIHLAPHNFLLFFVKHILTMLLSSIHLLIKTAFFSEQVLDDSGAEEDRSSPSLVPIPLDVTVTSIKEKLPVVLYSCLKERLGLGVYEKDKLCAVCLRYIKESDEVREICGCIHVFHRECIDGWIDVGQITCPLCRSRLISDQGEKVKHGGDPWRRERMIYLFGEDYVMGTQ